MPPPTDPAPGASAPRGAAGWVAAGCAAVAMAAGCAGGGGARGDLSVFAAASLTDVVGAMRPEWEAATGRRIVLNLGASGSLARQILAAPRADVFISADEEWMDRVEEEGLIQPGTRRTILSNTLVVVVPSAGGARIDVAADLLRADLGRISIAQPDAVPAGRYAREWLRAEGVWDALAPRVVPAVDVRAALAAVEAGHAGAGVVYRTDAIGARRVRIALECRGATAPAIAYPAAALRAPGDAAREEAARRALDWLSGPAARAHFQRHGFLPAGGPGDPAP